MMRRQWCPLLFAPALLLVPALCWDLHSSALPAAWDQHAELIRAITPEGKAADPEPQEITTYVTAEDGTKIWTRVTNPYPYDKKKAAVICRSPYANMSSSMALLFVQANGYAAVQQESRGTFSSGGTFNMFRDSSGDGMATMRWVAGQSWSNGDVYHVGFSADGIEEMSPLLDNPPWIRGMLWAWSSSNGHKFIYPGGMYRQDLIETYLTAMLLPTRGASWYSTIPAVRHHEPWSEWWSKITDCRNPSKQQAADCHFRQLTWPLIVSAGWWDIFQLTQLEAWTSIRMAAQADAVSKSVLVVDPLGHCSLDRSLPAVLVNASDLAMKTTFGIAMEFFAGNFAGPIRSKVKKVSFFVLGDLETPSVGNFWTSLEDWPSHTATELFLQGGSSLGWSTFDGKAGEAAYDYDPKRPTPIEGGYNIPAISKVKGCGSVDLIARDGRSDVVVFTSQPLADDMAIVGNISAKLFVTSSTPDTDFVVTVSDLSPQKSPRSMTVIFGAQRMRWRDGDRVNAARMTPGTVYGIDILLGHTAYVFPKGHSVRMTVSSAAAPFYETNHNTGEFSINEWFPTSLKARNSVHFSTQFPSRLILPVVALEDIPRNIGRTVEGLALIAEPESEIVI